MRMPVTFSIKNAQVIQSVNTNFSARVNDVIVIHNDAHMNDVAFFIVKKSQITGLAFFNKTQRIALGSLLWGIAL